MPASTATSNSLWLMSITSLAARWSKRVEGGVRLVARPRRCRAPPPRRAGPPCSSGADLPVDLVVGGEGADHLQRRLALAGEGDVAHLRRRRSPGSSRARLLRRASPRRAGGRWRASSPCPGTPARTRAARTAARAGSASRRRWRRRRWRAPARARGSSRTRPPWRRLQILAGGADARHQVAAEEAATTVVATSSAGLKMRRVLRQQEDLRPRPAARRAPRRRSRRRSRPLAAQLLASYSPLRDA